MLNRGGLWKSTVVLSLGLAFMMGFTPMGFAAEVALEQRTEIVRIKLVENGVSKERANKLVGQLSISEVEYLAANPNLLRELGQTSSKKEEEGADPAVALLGLLVLTTVVVWLVDQSGD